MVATQGRIKYQKLPKQVGCFWYFFGIYCYRQLVDKLARLPPRSCGRSVGMSGITKTQLLHAPVNLASYP